MKFAISVLLFTAGLAGNGSALSIPEGYLYKCDALEGESERIGCMRDDLAKLEDIKESVSVLGSPDFKMQGSDVDGYDHSNPHFRPRPKRKSRSHHGSLEEVTGDGPPPPPPPPPPPAPKPDPNANKIRFTTGEWYLFVFEVMIAYYCCQCCCIICINIAKKQKKKERFVEAADGEMMMSDEKPAEAEEMMMEEMMEEMM